MAESYFHGIAQSSGKVVEGVGAEVMEIVGGKIKEIRDYHRSLPAQAVLSVLLGTATLVPENIPYPFSRPFR